MSEQIANVSEYKFVKGIFKCEIEIKKSRFIATVCGEVDENGAVEFVKAIKKEYPDARHNCYAYIADEAANIVRFSDDGEPSGTAGQPILAVLKNFGLRKTAAVVTRYFGGVKLGANGLVTAYTKAVAECLKNAEIKTKKLSSKYNLSVSYPQYSALESVLRSNNTAIANIGYGDEVNAEFFVVADFEKDILEKISEKTNGAAKLTKCGAAFYEFE